MYCQVAGNFLHVSLSEVKTERAMSFSEISKLLSGTIGSTIVVTEKRNLHASGLAVYG